MHDLQVDIPDDYCGTYDENSPLESYSIKQYTIARLKYQSTLFTSISSSVIDGHTVIYLGTNDGFLKQVCYILQLLSASVELLFLFAHCWFRRNSGRGQ